MENEITSVVQMFADFGRLLIIAIRRFKVIFKFRKKKAGTKKYDKLFYIRGKEAGYLG